MKRIKLMSCFFMLFPLFTFSQYQVSGKVIDQNQNPIEFVNVILINPINSDIVKGTITDSTGSFKMEAPEDIYEMKMSFLGYKTLSEPLTLSENMNLGIIKMVEDAMALQQIILKSKKPLIERKIDRLVFNIQNSVIATKGNLLDALKITPRVNIKPTGEIGIIGKGNVNVLINGHVINLEGINLQNYLAGISSSDVKNIEVITTPPAKYSAEGSGGLINIILKNNKSDYFGGSIYSSYTQQKYADFTFGGSLKYEKNKVSFSTSINYNKGKIGPKENQTFYYNEYILDNKSKRKTYINRLSLSNTLRYKFSDKFSSGISYNYNNSENNQETNVRNYYINKIKDLVDSTSISTNFRQPNINLHVANAYIEYELDSLGKKITIDAAYLNKNNLSKGKLISDSYSNGTYLRTNKLKNTLSSKNEIKSAAINAELPFRMINLKLGIKLSSSKNYNDSKQFINIDGIPTQDNNASNIFIYSETTQAAYVSLAKNWQKWNLKAGLRAEKTQTKGSSITLEQNNKNEYVKFFPTFYLNYKPNENNTWGLNYSKRINRPSYRWLNPFRLYYSANFYTEGNPYLKPSFTNNINISYQYKKFYNELWFSTTKNDQRNFILVSNDSDIQVSRPENFIDRYSYGLYQAYHFNKYKWWELHLILQETYTLERYTNKNISINEYDILNFFINIKNSFVLNSKETIFLEVNYYYKSKFISSSIIVNNMQKLDLGLQFRISPKLNFTIYGNDLLGTTGTVGRSVPVNNIITEFDNFYDSRNFGISLRYNFGKKLKGNNRESIFKEELNRL